jgi:hypothetical protein
MSTAQAAAQSVGLGTQFNALLTKAGGDYDAFIASVEDWYDDHMDRVSGWYKREAQRILIVIGFALAVAFNVDSVRLYSGLTCSSALRGAVAIAASKAATPGSPADATFVTGMLNAVPLGWRWPIAATGANPWDARGWQLQFPDAPSSCAPATTPSPNPTFYWFAKIVGIVLTALALSLGAPFWFDALSCLVNVRAAGNKPASNGSSGK